jgi:hypothetical protein
MLLALSFLLYTPAILSGFWFANQLWSESTPQILLFKLFLGLPLGLGLWSLGYYLWIFAGLNKFVFPWLELVISLILSALTFHHLKVLFLAINLRSLKSPLNLAFLLVVAGVAVLFGLAVFMSPHGHEDAWFIWTLDARFIYLAQDWRTLYIPNGPGWHPDYPLLVSLNTVFGWVLLGQDSSRVQMAVTTLFTLALPGILFSGISIIKGTKQAVLAIIVLMASPMLFFYGSSQEADTPVAVYILASLVLTSLYFKTRMKKLLLLAGLVTSLAAWAKNEGFLFIVVNTFLVIVFLIILKQPGAFKDYAVGNAIPLGVILLFKATLPVSNDLFKSNTLPQLLDISRYQYILQKLFGTILGLGWWMPFSLILILLVYGLSVWFDIPETLTLKFVGLSLLLQLSGYFFIYLITPHDLVWHVNTSMERLLLQVFPSALFLFFYVTRSPDFNPSEGRNYASHD